VLDHYVHHVVLPAKRQIDAEYTSCATFTSDLIIILKTVLGRWNYSAGGQSHSFAEANSVIAHQGTRPLRETSGIRTEVVSAED
jgi:hypothetical protein